MTNLFDREKLTFKKYIYAWLVALRCIIGLHVFYVYASSFSSMLGGKWWTFLEATTTPITYIPYGSTDDNDKLYQHMLFQWCTEPVFSGSNISYQNTLCDIKTSDYKRFEVSVPANNTWSDWEPLTIEDVYFTYVSILQENAWNLDHLAKYQNITTQVNESQLIFTFPSSSIDNMIFFTNFILPQHILANQDYEYYTSTFANTLVSSTCVLLDTSSTDNTSTIFDLSQCEDYLLKYFQVKVFEDTNKIASYSEENSSKIDLIHTDINIPWYKKEPYISNKFSSLFYNLGNGWLTPWLRTELTKLFIAASADNPKIALDQFLFDAIAPDMVIDKEIFVEPPEEEVEDIAEWEPEIDDLAVPASIPLNQDTPKVIYEIQDKINNSIPLNISFDVAYPTMTISHNKGLKYTPESYSSANKGWSYNLNPTFRNIVEWENTYAVEGINEDGSIDTFEIQITYIPEPVVVEEEVVVVEEVKNEGEGEENTNEDTPKNRYRLIYFADELNTSTVQLFKKALEENDIDQYFEFAWFDDTNELDGKIAAWDFDMVIRTLDMWLRRDLSNIFESEDAYINPTWYTNLELTSLIQEYFISSEAKQNRIKSQIDQIYTANIPFVILGKKLESYQLNDAIDVSPFPLRMYVKGWRKPYIKDISTFSHTSVDRWEVFNISNFTTFIKNL